MKVLILCLLSILLVAQYYMKRRSDERLLEYAVIHQKPPFIDGFGHGAIMSALAIAIGFTLVVAIRLVF